MRDMDESVATATSINTYNDGGIDEHSGIALFSLAMQRAWTMMAGSIQFFFGWLCLAERNIQVK